MTYTPAANFNGSDSFTFTVRDSANVTSAPATVSLTVTAVNDAPSFTKGGNQSVAFNAPAQTVTGWATALSAGPTDESSQTLSFTVTNSNTALFSVQPAISPVGVLTYAPVTGTSGLATVTVTMKDTGGIANYGVDTSATQTFTITVAADAAPLATSQSVTASEDVAKLITLAGVSKVTPATLTYAIVANPANGTLTGTPPSMTYTPAANFNGSDSFTFTVRDSANVTSAPATVSLTVTAVNDAPSVLNVIPAQTATAGTAYSYEIPANTFADADSDPLTLSVAGLPSWATFDDVTGTISGTPTVAAAAVTVVVTANDGRGGTIPANLSLTVLAAANRAPTVANAIPAQTATAGTAYSYEIPANTFADADGDALTLSVTGLPSWATFTVGTRTIAGTPTAAAVTVVVTANDGRGGTVMTNLSLTVTVTPVDLSSLPKPGNNTSGCGAGGMGGLAMALLVGMTLMKRDRRTDR
jgi:hypothetical protein